LDNKALVVLIDLLIKDQMAKIELPEGPVGPRGLRGKDGNDFDIEDHKDSLIALIESHSNITLTSEQIESLKGRDGIDGRDGRDGRDGKSVYIEEVLPELSSELKSKIELMKDDLRLKFSDLTSEELESIRGRDGKDGKDFDFESHSEEIQLKIKLAIVESRDYLKLKFEDLSEDQKLELRGSRGQRGKSGKDFDFDENRDRIVSLINSFIESKLPELKLKFSDLTEDEVSILTGRNGRDGRDGKDFDFEESRIEIQNQICEYINSVKDYFKLTFSDLTEDEKSSLKLKFSDLTDEERLQIKGSRGQRGKPGVDGSDGKDAATWNAGTELPLNWGREGDLFLNVSTCDVFKMENGEWIKQTNIRGAKGLPGLNGPVGRTGPKGFDGAKGEDGKDAPYIIDVRLETYKDEEFRIVLIMSDGEKIISNYVDFPAVVRNYYYSTGVSGGGGSSDSNTEYFDEGVSQGTTQKINFSGPNISATKVGDTLEVLVNDSVGANPTEYFDESVSIGTAEKVNFSGPNVTASKVGDTVQVVINDSVGANPTEYFDESISLGTAEKVNFSGAGVTASKVGDTIQVVIPNNDTNTTDLKVYSGASLESTTDEIEFDSDDFIVTDVAGRAVVTLKSPGGTGSDLGIYDEYNLVTPIAKNINFVGDYVTVRQRVPIEEWNLLEDVEPNMAEYLGDGTSDTVDVFIDVPDSSLLKNVTCLSDVYVGSFVIINPSEVAENAMADSYSTSNVIGIVEVKHSSTLCDIRVSGISSDIFSGLDPALDYYLSDTVAGGISSSVPTISGHVKLKLGQSFGTNKFLFSKGERVVRL
jgi:hypothetical protein